MAKKKAKKKDTTANLGFEAKLWLAADKLRNNMDAAEYKHVVLGLIFLKYISDSFDAHHALRVAGEGEYEGADPEDPDEYRAENVFWVPQEARWLHLQDNAKQPTIGKLIDDAMVAIERDNQQLKGVLRKDYARPVLDKQRLGELIDLIGTIDMVAPTARRGSPAPVETIDRRSPNATNLPANKGDLRSDKVARSETGHSEGADTAHRSKDILGRVYEYFLSEFASAEGKKGGQFYTPSCVVRTLVEMLTPYSGRVYDPCCGSGGMFVQADKLLKAHASGNGNKKSGAGFQPAKAGIAIYGQESNSTTRQLALMNLAIRGIDGDLGKEHADTFRRDLHKDLKADYVIANPPFNDSDWHRNEDDVRWKYGTPPKSNANFAWVQHFIHHLSPTGTAGFVLVNGSMSSNRDKSGAVVSTAKGKPNRGDHGSTLRDRRGKTLFIDTRKIGPMIDRVHRELSEEDITLLAETYHNWQQDEGYSDIPGFCKSATLSEIAEHGHVLTPGRYVGAEEVEDDGGPLEAKMKRSTDELAEQFRDSTKLETAIRDNMKALRFTLKD